jgi:hypothetical protein
MVAAAIGPILLPVFVADSAERCTSEKSDDRRGSIQIEFPGIHSIERPIEPSLASSRSVGLSRPVSTSSRLTGKPDLCQYFAFRRTIRFGGVGILGVQFANSQLLPTVSME